jgi:hypothetical protein
MPMLNAATIFILSSPVRPSRTVIRLYALIETENESEQVRWERFVESFIACQEVYSSEGRFEEIWPQVDF